MLQIGERERANLVVQLARFFYIRGADSKRERNFAMLDQRSRGNGGGACAQSPHTVAVHFSQCVPYCYSWLQSILYTANMESVDGTTPSTVSHTARYVRLSASPCRLSRAHASGERVHAAGGQRVHAGCRSCVGKRCIVSALTRCVANITRTIDVSCGYHQLDRSRSPKMHCIHLLVVKKCLSWIQYSKEFEHRLFHYTG